MFIESCAGKLQSGRAASEARPRFKLQIRWR